MAAAQLQEACRSVHRVKDPLPQAAQHGGISLHLGEHPVSCHAMQHARGQ